MNASESAAIEPPLRVLIAEDDPVFRHLLQFTLQRAGMDAIAVADGEAAWQAIEQSQRFDVVVTDHQMPGMTGLELMDCVANSEHDPAIILCTAKGFEIASAEIQSRKDVIAVLNKPFSPKQLVQQIVDHLGRQ